MFTGIANQSWSGILFSIESDIVLSQEESPPAGHEKEWFEALSCWLYFSNQEATLILLCTVFIFTVFTSCAVYGLTENVGREIENNMTQTLPVVFSSLILLTASGKISQQANRQQQTHHRKCTLFVEKQQHILIGALTHLLAWNDVFMIHDAYEGSAWRKCWWSCSVQLMS